MSHNLKRVATPFYDERAILADHRKEMKGQKKAESGGKGDLSPAAAAEAKEAKDAPVKKEMHPYAARVLMKLLYAARMARFDLLKAINDLACFITDWDLVCDKKLYRLMCYVESTKHYRLTSYVGDSPDKLRLHLFADSDFAGCPRTKRSTSGVFFEVVGPNTSVPLTAISKRQRSISTSTSEAEIVAAFLGTTQVAIPSLSLWSYLLGHIPVVRLMEDNQSSMRIIDNGKSRALAHMSRTQGVALGWMAERYREDNFAIDNRDTEEQTADAMTKPIFDPNKWAQLLDLLRHYDPKDFWKARKPGSSTGEPASQGGGPIKSSSARRDPSTPFRRRDRCPTTTAT